MARTSTTSGAARTTSVALPLAPVRPLKLRKGQPRTLNLLAEASKFFRKRKIHPRRIIPKVPLGAERADPQPTATLSLRAPHAMAMALSGATTLANVDPLVLVRNVPLGAVADNDTASNVCEPSVAANGNVVFYTGNWFAAVSTDGGATFRYIDPYTAFPDPPGMGFCCDQVVHYIPTIDTFVWLLQYTENTQGANIQRLAFAKTADVALGKWRFYDIVPDDVGLPGAFLDFPDLTLGAKMLYVTTNAFAGRNWSATVLVRIPFSSIKSGSVTAEFTTSGSNFNFRVAQYGGAKIHWASHHDTSTLRVFSWSESAAQPTFKDVQVASWSEDDYQSITPDGFNWLGRADSRLVGATVAGTELWFAWGAGRGGANARPHPYVQIARIRTSGLKLLENINIWDKDSAICYGALASNSKKEVGASYMIGGGTRFPTHVVALLTGTRRDVVADAGSRGPKDGKWGDYLTVRRLSPNRKLFAATGYSLQPASTGILDATPQFVVFGRSSDV
jgi:hypothetical protein